MAYRYFKLGEKAAQFYDPISHTKIGLGEVIQLEKLPNNGIWKTALAGGHICISSEEEYKNYLVSQQKANPKATKKSEPGKKKEVEKEKDAPLTIDELTSKLDEMSKSEMVEWAEGYGFDETDMAELKKMKKAKDITDFILKQYPLYTSE